jgi:hypothetical protein
MAKGLGIAALVISILSIFVPVVTLYVVWLALALAAVAGFLGDRVFPIASLVICLVNIVFLSPLTWAALAGESMSGGFFLKIGTIIMFIAPIVGLILGAKKGTQGAQGA